MSKLSDKLSGLTYVPKPQSPQKAGMMTNLPPGAAIPEGWLELDGSTIVGADTLYPDLWANSPASWKSGSDLTLPDGSRVSAEVDLDATTSLGSGSSRNLKGIAYQGNLGKWRLRFNCSFNGTSLGSTPLITVQGIVCQNSQNHAITVRGNQNSICNGYSVANTNTIQANYSSALTYVDISGDIPLESKPTDAFVGADSRFSTFDEALEGIPVIKLYDDTAGTSLSQVPASASARGVIQLSSEFAAGNGAYGLVEANKTQKKTLTTSISAPADGTTVFQFNNLVVGRIYKLSGMFEVNYVNQLIIRVDELTDKYELTFGVGGSAPYELTFEATSTTCTLKTRTASSSSIVGISGSIINTWLELTELNNTIATTDFT